MNDVLYHPWWIKLKAEPLCYIVVLYFVVGRVKIAQMEDGKCVVLLRICSARDSVWLGQIPNGLAVPVWVRANPQTTTTTKFCHEEGNNSLCTYIFLRGWHLVYTCRGA